MKFNLELHWSIVGFRFQDVDTYLRNCFRLVYKTVQPPTSLCLYLHTLGVFLIILDPNLLVYMLSCYYSFFFCIALHWPLVLCRSLCGHTTQLYLPLCGAIWSLCHAIFKPYILRHCFAICLSFILLSDDGKTIPSLFFSCDLSFCV